MSYYRKKSMATMTRERAIDVRTLPMPPGDWSDMRKYSEHLKVWLSEEVAKAAGLLAEQYLHSQVIIVRNALVIHVYGRLMFDQLVVHRLLRAPRGYVPEIVDPKQVYWDERKAAEAGTETDLAREDPVAHRDLLAQDELHPATVALRIAMPPRLKRDLEELAKAANKPLSEYCREVLTAYYLGELRAVRP